MNSEYQLPLSDADQEALQHLGLRYRLYLDNREEELVLEILSSAGCIFEEGFYCRSFMGNHDSDAWASAIAKAHQALRDWLADIHDNQVEMCV